MTHTHFLVCCSFSAWLIPSAEVPTLTTPQSFCFSLEVMCSISILSTVKAHLVSQKFWSVSLLFSQIKESKNSALTPLQHAWHCPALWHHSVQFLITCHLYVKLTFTSLTRALNILSSWICIAPELIGPNSRLVIVHASASETEVLVYASSFLFTALYCYV